MRRGYTARDLVDLGKRVFGKLRVALPTHKLHPVFNIAPGLV